MSDRRFRSAVDRRVLQVLLAVVLLVLAGCAGVTAPTNESVRSPTTPGGPSTDDSTAPDRATTAERSPSMDADGATAVATGTARSSTPTRDREPSTAMPATPTPTNATPTPAAAAIDLYGVHNLSRDLPIDADRTFRRVEGLTGVDGDKPPILRGNMSQLFSSAFGYGDRPVFRVLGIVNVTTGDGSDPHGANWGDRAIVLQPAGASPVVVERILAHEVTHELQTDTGLRPTYRNDSWTVDRVFAARAVIEGGAVYVADAYSRRYLGATGNPQRAAVRREYESGTAGDRFFRAPYYYGARYHEARIDGPNELPAVTERPPWTSEQVLHNQTPPTVAGPAYEPPSPLSVETTVRAAAWDERSATRVGELFLRVTLREAVSRERAIAAAAGWGNDSARQFVRRDGERVGVVLVTTWDSAADAATFRSAARTYATARTADSPYTITVRPIAPRSVALVAGDPGFVANTTVSGGNESVSVTVGE